MNGAVAVSYAVLWVVVLWLVVLVLATLRQVGEVRLAVFQSQTVINPGPSATERDGPDIGAPMPAPTASSVNGFSDVIMTPQAAATHKLIAFLSPMCETCQAVVDDLNALYKIHCSKLEMVVVMHADESAMRSFLRVFPLLAPVICDPENGVGQAFGVRRNPFGLLYNNRGVLERKGVILGADDLTALIGGPRSSLVPKEHTLPSV